MTFRFAGGVLLLLTCASAKGRPEDGHEGWLRYAPLQPAAATHCYDQLPSEIVVTGDSAIEKAAAAELQRGLSSMLGRQFRVATRAAPDRTDVRTAVLLLTHASAWSPSPEKEMVEDSYALRAAVEGSDRGYTVVGGDARGELYGVFHLLELVATEQALPSRGAVERPAAPIRWVNQWDNFDGSIERGYAGDSIFFAGGHVRADLSRAGAYARLLASIGINGLTVNNVNSDLRTLDPDMLRELARVAAALRPWGVRMSLAVDLSSPQVLDHLPTFDPLDAAVIAWWQRKTDAIYALIPDFAGFVVKADSEGRAGPSQYHRTPAEAANLLAGALAPHRGLVLYRGFVYNHHLDWHDPKADRARAGYDNFHALDGTFAPNVVIQIKHGPIDFQVREPVSPLFAALEHTAQAIELQTSQEYTGQQRHMVFLVPMWKQVLDTDLRAQNRSTPVKEIVEGRSFHQSTGGFVSVVNVGLDANWLHHPMAMANLYGYGRLAWNPETTARAIVEDWTRLTFGNDPEVVTTISDLQLNSWHVYEQYTGPLGIGTLTDIIGVHFGPGVASAENNGWGQWFRADHEGVGMDRTVATGTGYIGQYPPQLAARYESLTTCPQTLLLFLHHVPYGYRLRSGKTVIQHFYDEHYAGAAAAASYPPRWETLRGKVDAPRFAETLALFRYQAGHALVWRDAVDDWFARMSGVPDAQGRVGHHPGRIEAESMIASGYQSVDVTPWETASGGKAMICEGRATCTLTTTIDRPAGQYTIAVQYFDLRGGVSQFELLLNGRQVAQFAAGDTLPPAVNDVHLDGHTSTRFTTRRLALRPGDTLTLRGTPHGGELAPVDYLEIER